MRDKTDWTACGGSAARMHVWLRQHRCQGLLTSAVQQAVKQVAQVVLVHMGLHALGQGRLPPEIDSYGGVLAVYLMPPPLRNEQCIPSLQGWSSGPRLALKLCRPSAVERKSEKEQPCGMNCLMSPKNRGSLSVLIIA
ncbi:MAG: hypothetical protein FRX49_02227 [Trebouxia sp. A1-2]|nr:MAG: hypothetical protein FRX49_02227 [Trebouxia sp. A1-2]